MFESPLKLDSPWQEFLAAIDEQLTAPAQITCIRGFPNPKPQWLGEKGAFR